MNLKAEVWLRIEGSTSMYLVGSMTADEWDLNNPTLIVAQLREAMAEVAAEVQPLLNQTVTVNVTP